MKFVTNMFCAAVVFMQASCSSTIYVVRHKEKESAGNNNMMVNDPNLSTDGLQRANALAAALAKDKINGIFATPYKRTKQTAEPVAVANKIFVTIYNPKQGNKLIDSLALQKGKRYLVVGHSNTVPGMLRHLQLQPSVEEIPENDFDNLFIIRIKWFLGRHLKLQELHYGEVSP
jgi:broad specificity phosphatase PhoE